jgi:hypothetical protein
MPASGKLQTYLSNVLPKTSGIKKIAKITPSFPRGFKLWSLPDVSSLASPLLSQHALTRSGDAGTDAGQRKIADVPLQRLAQDFRHKEDRKDHAKSGKTAVPASPVLAGPRLAQELTPTPPTASTARSKAHRSPSRGRKSSLTALSSSPMVCIAMCARISSRVSPGRVVDCDRPIRS